MPHEDAEPAPEPNAAAQAVDDGSSSMPGNETSPGSDTIAEAVDDDSSSGPDNETTEAGPVDVQMADV